MRGLMTKSILSIVLLSSFAFGQTKTTVMPQQGGTGKDSSHWTGCVRVDNGIWSFVSGSCGGGTGGTVIQVNGTPISPSTPANFVNNGSVTWDFTGGAIHATASGGGGTPGAPPTSVQYNNSGAFGGSAKFVTDANGNVQILGGGTLEIESPTNPSEFWLFDGQHLFVQSDGTDGELGGIDLIVNDGGYPGSSTGLVPLFVQPTVFRAAKNTIGLEISPKVSTVAANGNTGVEVDNPQAQFGGTFATSIDFYGATDGTGAQVTGAERGLVIESHADPTNATYCDAEFRTNGGATRTSFGCGTTHANTMSGPTTFSGTGIPIAVGTTSNTDLAGFITLSGGTGTYNFTATHATAPVCVVSETTDATKTVKGSASTTVLTVTGTGTDVIAYICIGRT